MDKQIEEMYQEFLRYKFEKSTPETFSYKGMCEHFQNVSYRKGFSREEVDEISKTAIKNSRKETAEKFAEKLKKVIHERDYVEGYAFLGICEEIDEICKELTEG